MDKNLLKNIIGKIKVAMLALTILVSVVLPKSNVYASVIYKDISSISIRTNFNFDYESISEEGLPEITYNSEGNNEDMVYIYENAKYEIESCEWYSAGNDDFEIGGTPRVVVYLVTKDYDLNNNSNNDYYYRFLSSYSSSTCFISKGNFVSASRTSTSSLKVVFSLAGLKGDFYPPENAYWQDERGIAVWEPSNICDSGYYDLVLYRGGSVVARVDRYKGNTYNFASYFTKEGDYMFKVRTVGGTDNQATYGKNSEYVESGSVMVDENIVAAVLNGSINTSNANGTIYYNNSSGNLNVGWIQMNGTWYFYKPDGTQVTNNWMQWNNNWYFLDDSGQMKVGLLTVNNRTYYLGNDGAMVTGWININDTFYYFDTNSGDNFGAMLQNGWILYDNKYFYFDEKGVMTTGWKQIRDQRGNVGYYYFYPKGTTNGLYGYMATNTTINGFTVGADGRWIQG